MIILKVIGGLGNQMFQLAYARSLSLKFGDPIYIDRSSYDRYKTRPFSAHHLHMIDSINYLEDITIGGWDKTRLKLVSGVYRIAERIKRELADHQGMGRWMFQTLANRGLLYNFDVWYYDIEYRNHRVKHVYGYFQSHKYFDECAELVKTEMRVKTPPTEAEKTILRAIETTNAVGVSIRLGDDYLRSSLNVCDEDYFRRGMDYVRSVNKDVVFYIFSDRIDRVKERYSFDCPVVYVEGFRDYENLRLLYSCRHFVIANSSFSWWGAYLASSPGKIIVVPSRWFPSVDGRADLYTDDMVVMEV